MTASYEVMGEHYEGDSVSSSPEKIAPEDIKSMQSIPISVSSYSYGDYKPSIVKSKSGKVYAATRTANNLFLTSLEDFSKYGFFSQIDDSNMDEFKSAGEDFRPNMFDIIPKMPNLSYIAGISAGLMNFPDPSDTAVALYTTPEFVNAVDINKVGYFVSKAGNLNNFLRNNLLFDDANNFHYDASQWVKFLNDKGYSIETTNNAEFRGLGIGVDVAREGFLAAYYSEKGYLITEKDFSDKVGKIMSSYGQSSSDALQAMMRADLLHEIGHRFGIGGDRASEELQGELREEFYTRLSENFKGTRFEQIYRALAQEGRDYSEAFSLTNSLLGELTADLYPKQLSGPIGIITNKARIEGEAIGLQGEYLARFINERLENIYGELIEEEPSHEESLDKKNDLEARVRYLGQYTAESEEIRIESKAVGTEVGQSNINEAIEEDA